jgi:hypothetical protein
MAQAGTEPVTEQHGIPPVDRVRRMIAMACPVPRRCVIRGHLEGETRWQLPSALAMTLVQEPLELGDRNRVARDPERLDGAREPIDDLRARIVRIRADLDGYLTAVDAAPLDVRQAVGAQADARAAVAQDGEAHADARPRLVAEGQAVESTTTPRLWRSSRHRVRSHLAPAGMPSTGCESRNRVSCTGGPSSPFPSMPFPSTGKCCNGERRSDSRQRQCSDPFGRVLPPVPATRQEAMQVPRPRKHRPSLTLGASNRLSGTCRKREQPSARTRSKPAGRGRDEPPRPIEPGAGAPSLAGLAATGQACCFESAGLFNSRMVARLMPFAAFGHKAHVARDLNAELDVHRLRTVCQSVIDEYVVTISAQARGSS